jgi:lipase (class 3)
MSMRGSASIANWIADILYFQKPCGDEIGIPGGKCEQGFWTFWDDSRKAGALDAVEKALGECQGCQIVVTGHSLGGAGAVFGAVELRKKYPNTQLYSYGQPRVGDEVLSAGISAQGNNFRITHTTDIVPQLPWETIATSGLPCPDCRAYAHITPEYHIMSGLGNKLETYKIHEGIKNYDGNAGSKFNLDIIGHLQYYQANIVSLFPHVIEA